MTSDISKPLSGVQMDTQSARFVGLEKLKGAPRISSPRGYAQVAEEFLAALELLPGQPSAAFRPRVYLAAQALELILRAYIARFDKKKLEKLRDYHDIVTLSKIALEISNTADRKLSIPTPDLPTWWEELAWLHGSPYLDRYPNEFPFFTFEAGDPRIADKLRPLLKEVEAALPDR